MDAVTPRWPRRVLAAAAARGWCQRDLAQHAGLTPDYLSRLLRGRCPITHPALVALAFALDVHEEVLTVAELADSDRTALLGE